MNAVVTGTIKTLRAFSDSAFVASRLFVITTAIFFSASFATFGLDGPSVELQPARDLACNDTHESCKDFDAIVFVHGIYGDEETFKSKDTGFDWPAEIPATIDGRAVDVFVVDYYTELIDWSAKSKDTTFATVAEGMFTALKPLRQREYRSIGFVAHSLGGNFVSAYLLTVKAARSTSGLAQHAFAITLATPVMGSQIANMAGLLKTLLGMNDSLLSDLKEGTSLQSFLKDVRRKLKGRAALFGCRDVNLHAAIETLPLAGIAVVEPESAAAPVASLVSSPVMRFDRDHSSIAKPVDQNDEVYVWAAELMQTEYERIGTWEENHPMNSPNRYCEDVPFKKE